MEEEQQNIFRNSLCLFVFLLISLVEALCLTRARCRGILDVPCPRMQQLKEASHEH